MKKAQTILALLLRPMTCPPIPYAMTRSPEPTPTTKRKKSLLIGINYAGSE